MSEVGGIALRVMMANSPLSYREAISAALESLRPHFEVFTAEPADLDWEFSLLSPQFVVCSRVTELVEREASGWIELYPEGGHESVVSLGGQKMTHPQMDFPTLLSVLDEVERRLDETA